MLGSLESEAAKRKSKRQIPDYDFGFGSYAPDFGFIDPFAFHQQLTQQILAQQAAQQQAIASTFVNGDAMVSAGASNMPDYMDDEEAIYRQQQALFDYARRQSHYNGKGNRYAPNYSAAAASIGPGGAYQTAYISPGNPAIPNISNRFSSTSPGGFKGVSVSSYSSSSDVNGKRTSNRGAQTTINDNGRITTYKVNS
uniref:Vitamin B12 dependent methionine synthase n=1 Tax=Musca domestica TaxID=7370 RepID=T1PBZ5_MUSDO